MSSKEEQEYTQGAVSRFIEAVLPIIGGTLAIGASISMLAVIVGALLAASSTSSETIEGKVTTLFTTSQEGLFAPEKSLRVEINGVEYDAEASLFDDVEDGQTIKGEVAKGRLVSVTTQTQNTE